MSLGEISPSMGFGVLNQRAVFSISPSKYPATSAQILAICSSLTFKS
jgi:hypothetical protein